jgi:hypothetical protein
MTEGAVGLYLAASIIRDDDMSVPNLVGPVFIAFVSAQVEQIISLLCLLHTCNGFQWWTFPFLKVPELSVLGYQLLTATVHNDRTAAAVLLLTH